MMENTGFYGKIEELIPDIEIKRCEPMARHTSFRIGGPVEVMVFPKNIHELSALMKLCAEAGVAPAILGAGTNILAPDAGIKGIVICMKDAMDGMERIDQYRIRIAAGVTMSRAAVFAATQNLGGLEFAHGIPGTVGGGVYMNAGAYGGEIADICETVDVMTTDGEVKTLSCSEMGFSYRHSRLEEDGGIVVNAVFKLTPRPESEIRAQMQDFMLRRKASQPLDLPSAGSAFKRPVGGYAAALIDQAGLKGYRIGDAAVSEKHAGFVVNLGCATAKDVTTLMRQVAEKVFENSGIKLDPEVRFW